MLNFSYTPAPQPIDDFQGWLVAFTQPTVLVEMLVLAVCLVLAWGITIMLRRGLTVHSDRSIWFGARDLDGVLFPLVLLCLGYAARVALNNVIPMVVLKVAVPVLVSLVVIRVGVKVLQVAFTTAPWVRFLERSLSWLAWLAMVLWVSGLLPVVLNEMDEITWKMGAGTLSLRGLLAGLVTASAVLILTLWVSSAIETRLLRTATGSELSLRKAVSNATRALLMFVGLMVALSSSGIDLTSLSVLGGAVGVGIGFGLQKLASNYISGFVILAERSMRIGDNVKVDEFEGCITAINARYTVVRSPQGRESIVPNELLINNRVENLSLADPNLHQTTVVSVDYNADVDLVTRLLMEAALSEPHVLREPAPTVALSNFGADGLEFTVGYWINLENGRLAVRSAVNMAILRALRAHQIDIPYPQRVVHTPALPPSPAAPGSVGAV